MELPALVVEALSDLVADDCADDTVVDSAVRARIEIRRLEDPRPGGARRYHPSRHFVTFG
jgi:hypothetical protein